MRVAVYTLGCRLNFAETEELIDILSKKNLKISLESPQVIIVRGCSVTQKAEKETRLTINELRKKEKKAFIIASGCLRKNFSCPSANLVLCKEKEKEILRKIEKLRGKKSCPPLKAAPAKLRTRSFIKIQDGCENYCTYCLVPYLRGKERSRESEKIIKTIKKKEKAGYQEIVLTGVNIGKWRQKNKDFYWLIKEILKKTEIPRIRISSLWPDKINKKFIDLFKNQRLCQHLHLSLQSLSQSVLKRMNRTYQVKEIKRKIKNLKKKFPDLTITADIIVGFPGETVNEFKETLKNIKKVGLAKIHVFRYSPRENTAAASMENQVKESIKKKRAKILLFLSEKLNKRWRKKFVYQIKNILFEQKKDDFWHGFTDNYLKVYVKDGKDLSNRILSVKLVKLYKEGILATTKYEIVRPPQLFFLNY